MSLSDPVADMLTKIRNASSARFESVDISTSKLKLEITKILKNEGYIKTFKKVTQDGRNLIRIFLKYDGKNTPVITRRMPATICTKILRDAIASNVKRET